MIKSGNVVIEDILGGHLVRVFCPDHADHCCGVGYMDIITLCLAQNLWVTNVGMGTDS